MIGFDRSTSTIMGNGIVSRTEIHMCYPVNDVYAIDLGLR